MSQFGRPAPTVSVVVPHYNALGDLDRCLRALAAQIYPRDRYDIIVADNNSPQGEAAVAAVVGDRARLVFVHERGAGPARNGGADVATGEILAFTDCDCVVEPSWLNAGVEALSRFDVVGGQMTVLVEDPAAVTPAEAFERVFAFRNDLYVRLKGFTVTANLFCRRDTFLAVGGFAVGISEDIEWSRRATASGYRLGYAPEAIVGHPARRTWADLIVKWRRISSETFALTDRGLAARLAWAVRSLAMPASALVDTPKVLASRQLDTLGQRLGALSVLYRHRFWRMAYGLRLAVEAGPHS